MISAGASSGRIFRNNTRAFPRNAITRAITCAPYLFTHALFSFTHASLLARAPPRPPKRRSNAPRAARSDAVVSAGVLSRRAARIAPARARARVRGDQDRRRTAITAPRCGTARAALAGGGARGRARAGGAGLQGACRFLRAGDRGYAARGAVSCRRGAGGRCDGAAARGRWGVLSSKDCDGD